MRNLYIFFIIFDFLISQLVLNEFMASNDETIFDDYGDYDDWIEVFNVSNDTVNLFGWYLSDNDSEPLKYCFSDSIYIPPNSFLLIWADNELNQGVNHVNFKISSTGEELILSNPNMIIIDSVYFDQQQSDVSYGRFPDFYGPWGKMLDPSPVNYNSEHDSSIYINEIYPSMQPGTYFDNFYLDFTSIDQEVDIYYTLDGSIPNENSYQYDIPILIDETTVVRTIAMKSGHLPSKVQTFNYILNEHYTLPIITLTIEPENFPVGSAEYPVHVTYFNADGHIGFSTDAGVENHGSGASQGSYRLEFKTNYGLPYIEYPLFAHRSNNRHKRLILRNASNDKFPSSSGNTNRAHLRDVFIHSVYSNMYPESGYSSHHAVNLYINDDYWGIYYIRERQDRFYIEENFGFNEVDLLERAFGFASNKNAIEGDWDIYNELEEFIDLNDFNLDENFNYLRDQIYYEEFIDYWILEVYVGNFDWLANNMKYFRARSNDSKWRWLLWDVDHGLGMDHLSDGISWGNVETDYLSWSTGVDGPRVWNGQNNRVIRAILQNSQGQLDFINQFTNLLNTTFKKENLSNILDSLISKLSDDMVYHADRWGSSLDDWNEGIINIRNYIENRSQYVINHIKEKFSIVDDYNITIQAPISYNGYVKINSITINDFPWTGIYFDGMKIDISALYNHDEQYFSWSHLSTNSNTFQIESLSNDTTFILAPGFSSSLLINEILVSNESCCADNYNENEKFIEIFNGSDSIINMSGMVLKTNLQDSGIVLNNSDSMILEPNNFLVLWNDGELQEGYNHIDLSIDDSSNKLYLLNESESTILDSVFLVAQEIDVSFGRYGTGLNTWISTYPTPGYNNISLQPVMSISADSLYFEAINPYDSISSQIIISNEGYLSLVIDSVITNSTNLDKSFELPVLIEPNSSKSLDFVFKPTDIGEFFSEVILFSNDPINPEKIIYARPSAILSKFPKIISIEDIPNDQGYSLNVKFLSSIYDGIDTTFNVEGYYLLELNENNSRIYYDTIFFLPAQEMLMYENIISTDCNFSSDSLCIQYYKISTKIIESDSIIFSNGMFGYAMDNVAPNAPIINNIGYVRDRLKLTWEIEEFDDLMYHTIEKSSDSNFVDCNFFVKSANDTSILFFNYDINDSAFFRISTTDSSNNKSELSNVIRFPEDLLTLNNYSELPKAFHLHQNFPNPFNPTTQIRYDNPTNSFIKISIYDINGREIKTLINETQPAGYYHISWDSKNNFYKSVSAGVYILKIQSENYLSTRKMILLK